MNIFISTSMILGALLLLEASHSNVLEARGGHGGGGHEAVGRPIGRPDASPREQARQDTGNRPIDSTVAKDVNRQVDRDIRIDNRTDYYGVGGYNNTLNQGCWTGADGTVRCN
jgi:hypothetical protein